MSLSTIRGFAWTFPRSVAKIWSRYTMQYKGSAAAKLREKHRKGGSKLDVGHYGPGGGSSQRAYGGRSGEDVIRAADHVRDYRGRLDDRDRRRGDRRDPGRSLGIEGLDDRRDRDRSRRDRSRERSRRDRDRERRKRSRSRERSRRRHYSSPTDTCRAWPDCYLNETLDAKKPYPAKMAK